MKNDDFNDKDLDFVDMLMSKAFNKSAPKAPEFKSASNKEATVLDFNFAKENDVKKSRVEAYNDEDLDFLCAAGTQQKPLDDDKNPNK